jgi:FtsZ-interacting cell division protein ZipA
MVALARNLADDLDGVILDERGSSWSIQRERYVREEIIQFHHQLSRD